MKKIVLSLAVLASVALVSCGNKTAATADTDSAAVDTVATEVVDSAAATDSVAPAADSTPAADTAKAQ